MKQKQYQRYDLHSIPAGLIELLAWKNGQRLRPYVKDDMLVLEKSEGNGVMSLVQFYGKNLRYKIHVPKLIVESLGWKDKQQCMGIAYGDKLIICKTVNRHPSRSAHYCADVIKTIPFVLPKILEWFE